MKIKIYAYWYKYPWHDGFRIGVSEIGMQSPDSKAILIPAGEFELDLDILPMDREKASIYAAILRDEANRYRTELAALEQRIRELEGEYERTNPALHP